MKRLILILSMAVMFIITSNTSEVKAQDQFLAWTLKTGGAIYSYPVVNDTILYFGGMDNTFYAVHTMTGEILWSYDVPYFINSRALVHDGKVYFECGFRLYALDALTGDSLWSWVASAENPVQSVYDTDYHHSSPFFYDGTIYLADGWSNISGLNPETGELEFQYNTGVNSPIRSTPVIQDSVLYFGDWDSRVYAVSLKDSSVLWKDTLDGIRPYYGAIVSEFVIHDTLLYFGSQHDIYSPRDIRTGQPVWVFDDHKQTYLPSTPVFYGDSVIIGTTINSNRIYSVYNGELNWEFPTDGICFVKPVIEDTVLFMNTSNFGGVGHLYAIDARTGKRINEIQFANASPTSPAISGDLLFFGDNNGNMNAYRYKMLLTPDTLSISLDTDPVDLVINRADANYNGKIQVNNIGIGCDFVTSTVEMTGNSVDAGISCPAVNNKHLPCEGSLTISYMIKPSKLENGEYKLEFSIYSARHPEKVFHKTVNITIEGVSNTNDELTRREECKFFPLPAGEKINLLLTNQQPGKIEITIYNSEGKEVFNKRTNCTGNEYTCVIPLDGMPQNGLLLYTIRSVEQVYSGKILVNK